MKLSRGVCFFVLFQGLVVRTHFYLDKRVFCFSLWVCQGSLLLMVIKDAFFFFWLIVRVWQDANLYPFSWLLSSSQIENNHKNEISIKIPYPCNMFYIISDWEIWTSRTKWEFLFHLSQPVLGSVGYFEQNYLFTHMEVNDLSYIPEHGKQGLRES